MSGTTSWDAVPRERVSDLVARRMICGEKLMLVRWEFSKGGYVALHQHPHEQVVVVETGRLKMTIGGEPVTIEAGGIRVISADTPHDAEVLEDTVAIDIFSPPREDFLSGAQPDYLTRGR